MPRILFIGDDFRLLASRAALLAKTGVTTVCCNSAEMQKELARENFDLVVLCHSLSEEDARQTAVFARHRWPQAKVFLMESSVSLNKVFDGVAVDGMISSTPGRLLEQLSAVLRTLPKVGVQGAGRLRA